MVHTTIMTSCDPVYLHLHAGPLMLSAVLADNPFHLDCIDATPDDIAYMEDLLTRCFTIASAQGKKAIITFSAGRISPPGLTSEERRVVYACERFLTAGELFHSDTLFHNDDRRNTAFAIVDTDCLVLQKFSAIEEPIGLFLRDSLPGTTGWEAEGTRVAAGLVYVKNDHIGRIFLNRVAEEIARLPRQWFADQRALSIVNGEYGPKSVHRFGPDVLDWEFMPGTVIWTGKGNRKHTNETYLAKKKEYEDLLSHAAV